VLDGYPHLATAAVEVAAGARGETSKGAERGDPTVGHAYVISRLARLALAGALGPSRVRKTALHSKCCCKVTIGSWFHTDSTAVMLNCCFSPLVKPRGRFSITR
jgi:hypothetical protein